MKQKFINCSNHPSTKWSEKQKNAALNLAQEIIDFPFPEVNPSGDEKYISNLSKMVSDEIKKLGGDSVVMIQGESNLCYRLVNDLKENYDCIASTTKRNTVIEPDGTKKVNFEFERFRKYQ